MTIIASIVLIIAFIHMLDDFFEQSGTKTTRTLAMIIAIICCIVLTIY